LDLDCSECQRRSHFIVGDDTITVADADGVVLIEHTRPAPGTTYIGRSRGPRPNQAETSPKS
jgi:putative transposase